MAAGIAVAAALLAMAGSAVAERLRADEGAAVEIAALSRSAGERDRLPAGAVDYDGSRVEGADSVRLLREDRSHRHYAAPGADNTICLIVEETEDRGVVRHTSCQDRGRLGDGGVVLVFAGESGATVVGLLEDGFEAVLVDGRPAEVNDNLYVVSFESLHAAHRADIEALGSGVSLRIELP